MIDLPAFVRFAHLAAVVLLAGIFSFSVFIASPAFYGVTAELEPICRSFSRTVSRIAGASLLLVLTTAVVGLWLQNLNVGGVSGWGTFDSAALKLLLTETQYGRVWTGRMLLSLFLAGLFLFECYGSNEIQSFAFSALGFVLSALLLTSVALSGHAAAAEGIEFVLRVCADALHLLAAGCWLGGLIPLAILLGRCERLGHASAWTTAREAVRRFSALALASVAVLIGSGGYNAWFLVGTVPALVGTAYGKLLLVKIALLFPLLSIAAVNLLKLKPRLLLSFSQRQQTETADAMARLKRNAMLEASFGAMILLIVGSLGVTPPALHVQPDWPFSFRWSWRMAQASADALRQTEGGATLAIIGLVALFSSILARRKRRLLIGFGAAASLIGGTLVLLIITIDAYPTTYRRPAVTYHSISVANGAQLYRDSCVVCHGAEGYGDGPAAQDINPKPADLTARHAIDHTAGDLYWWLSYGVKDRAMPGFSLSLSPEERWDLINYVRALSSAEKARALASVIEEDPWLVAPDFTYGTDGGETTSLKEFRGKKMVLLVFFSLWSSLDRLSELSKAFSQFHATEVDIILIPNDIVDYRNKSGRINLGLPIVTEGSTEIAATYALFARSFAGENPDSSKRHMELLIDKQGYIRARWLPDEGVGWGKLDNLMRQIEQLRAEKPRAPAPDDHVH